MEYTININIYVKMKIRKKIFVQIFNKSMHKLQNINKYKFFYKYRIQIRKII